MKDYIKINKMEKARKPTNNNNKGVIDNTAAIKEVSIFLTISHS